MSSDEGGRMRNHGAGGSDSDNAPGPHGRARDDDEASMDSEDLDDVRDAFAVGGALHRAVMAHVRRGPSDSDFDSMVDDDGGSTDGDSHDGGYGRFWDEPPGENRHSARLFFAPFRDGAFPPTMAERRREYLRATPVIPSPGRTRMLWAALDVALDSGDFAPLAEVSCEEHPGEDTEPAARFQALSDSAAAELQDGALHHLRDPDGRTILMLAVSSGEEGRAFVERICCTPTPAVARHLPALLLAIDHGGLTAAHCAATLQCKSTLDSVLRALCEQHTTPAMRDLRASDGVWAPPPGATVSEVLEGLLTMQPPNNMPSLLSLVALSVSLATGVKHLLLVFAPERMSLSHMLRRAQSVSGGADTPLHLAASLGSVDGIRFICSAQDGAAGERTRLDAPGRNGETPLHRAAVCMHERAFETMLTYPALAAAVHAPAPEGWTPEERELLDTRWAAAALASAAYDGDEATVPKLLKQGAKVSLGEAEPDTALHAAALGQAPAVIRAVLGVFGPAKPDNSALAAVLAQPDRAGLSPIHCALFRRPSRSPAHAEDDHKALRDALTPVLDAHAACAVSVDQRSAKSLETPLHKLCAVEAVALVERLLDMGADVNAANRRQETPLMAAAMAGAVQTVKVLLRRGADVRAVTSMRESVLHMLVSSDLCSRKELPLMRVLLDAGADVHAPDAEGRTVVEWVAEMGRHSVLKELLQRGGTIDWAKESGYDAFGTLFKEPQNEQRFSLREAQLSGEHTALAVELARGRDVAFVGSLVNRAIGEGFHKMGSAVLEDHKLEVDAEGLTLLMHATLNGWDSLVKHLVYLEGVDIQARNRAGQTAIELAVAQGEWESFLDLYGAGAKPPDSPNAELMLAASLHQWRRVEQILQQLVSAKESEAAAAAAAHGNLDLATLQAASQAPASAARVTRGSAAAAAGAPAAGTPTELARRLQPDGEAATLAHADDDGEPPAKRARPADDAGPSDAPAANGASGATRRSTRAATQRITRAGTPIPPADLGRSNSIGNSAIGTGAEGVGASPATAALAQLQGRSASGAVASTSGAPPATPTRRFSLPARVSGRTPADGASGDGGRRSGEGAGLDVASLTWLITLLMHPRGDSLSQQVGQPGLAMRDRMLLLLRPMMNFQEKVAYFLEEQDHLLDAQLQELGDDETLHIEVRRGDDVLSDAVRHIAKASEDALMRELTVSFVDEDGEDGGGVLKEFCQELAAVVTRPSTAVFKEVPENSGCYQPSEQAVVQADSIDVEELFWALGVVVAKAVPARACFPMRFTKSFLKQMLGEELTLDDLKDVDAQLHKGLMALLASPLADLGMDDMTFTTETHFFGKTETAELKPGGAATTVTDENKAEYVQLLANFKMTESVKPFIKAFCEGLWSCLSIDSLRVFSPEQLGLLISGRPDISIKEMHACVKYEGFTADDATIRWFWELVREMHQQDVAKLLAFMTGSPRVPATGFKAMRSPLLISRAGEMRMPSAHTCANQLVLAQYSDKAALRQHLQEALKQPQGFHFR